MTHFLADGKGLLESIEGDRYEGEFADGKRHGQGEMVWFNGDRYVGEWKDDHINGTHPPPLGISPMGILMCLIPSLEGTGTVAMANGVTYAGQWQNGLVRFLRTLFP